MLVNLNDVLQDARKNKYAIGLFNTVNLEMAKGVLEAAEELRSPVIIGTAEIFLNLSSLEELAPLLVSMAKRASVPVVLHLDHGLTQSCIFKAIDIGFSSIMYDCSNKSFDQNMNNVKKMVEYAHQRGISVEAELGHIGSGEDAVEGTKPGDHGLYTDPFDAKLFAESTGVDALAIAIGTVHGTYKSAPRLDFERLKRINELVNIPLVLHGGSGLSDDDFRKSIIQGISKINIFTDINIAAAEAAYNSFRKGCGMTELIKPVTAAVKHTVMTKMQLFGSPGHG